ncbi:MAG TPA: ThuA domain-containing protein [Abditibacteriaceae bacterium]|nr:ThuA domain-containing protein [Abditibacteriaceae bacterium]
MAEMIRVTVWNENLHEQTDPRVRDIYPQGIHGALAGYLRRQNLEVATATLDQPQHGLTEEVLKNTDVLTWWGHGAHDKVEDEIVDRVHRRVLEGMGLIVLHSGHFSKIFKKLMGTTCNLKWREADEKERIWAVQPGHPIAEGVGEYFELTEEMYGEFFDIPQPEQLVFVSWFEGGEIFRSGCTYTRGNGKIFYFRPGHETYPTYHNPQVLKVIGNAVRWAAPSGGPAPVFGNVKPLEEIKGA